MAFGLFSDEKQTNVRSVKEFPPSPTANVINDTDSGFAQRCRCIEVTFEVELVVMMMLNFDTELQAWLQKSNGIEYTSRP